MFSHTDGSLPSGTSVGVSRQASGVGFSSVALLAELLFTLCSDQRAKAVRWTHGGEVEMCFEDTEVEVHGHKFEAARINYDGSHVLSRQTLWYGPWMLDRNR